jgi:hypothetical protein
MAQGAGHAVLEGLGAEDQGVGMGARLTGQVLAPAEPDLDPHRLRLRHQGKRFKRTGRQADGRQQAVKQSRLPRLDRTGLDAAEGAEGAVGLLGRGHGR